MSVYETHPHIRNPKFSSFDQRWNSSKTKNLHQKHKINLLWCHSNKIWINYHWYGPDFSVPLIFVLIFGEQDGLKTVQERTPLNPITVNIDTRWSKAIKMTKYVRNATTKMTKLITTLVSKIIYSKSGLVLQFGWFKVKTQICQNAKL